MAPRRSMWAVLVALVVVLAACGTSAPASSAPTSPAATASAVASVAATASAPATPSAAASASAATVADPMETISIAAPYAFEPLPAATAAGFEAAMKAGLGAMSSIVHVGARSVTKDGLADGMVLAMAMPGVPGTDSPNFLDAVALGAAGSAQAKVTNQTVEGHDVRVIEASTGVFAFYKHGTDTIVMVVGRTNAQTVGIIGAVIKATE